VQRKRDGEKTWHDHLDPVLRLRDGGRFDTQANPADYFAVSPLDGLAPRAGWWLHLPDLAAGMLQAETGREHEHGAAA
jgi:hypothetical protein